MTTKDLIQTISQKTGWSPKKTEKALLVFQKILEEALKKGESVKIRNFGTFFTRILQAKPIPLNFKKGGPRQLRVRKKSVGFKVSHTFKEDLKRPPAHLTQDYNEVNLDKMAQSYPGLRLFKSLINLTLKSQGQVLHLINLENPPAGGKTLVKIRKGENLANLGEFSGELFKRIADDLKKIFPELSEKENKAVSFLLDKAPPSPKATGGREKTKVEAEINLKEEPPAELTIHLINPPSTFDLSQPFPRDFYLALREAFNQKKGLILGSSLRQGNKLNLAQALIEEFGENSKVAILTDGLYLTLSCPHQNFDLRETPPAGGRLSQILNQIRKKGFQIILIDSVLILPDLKKLLKLADDHLIILTLVSASAPEAIQKFQKFSAGTQISPISISVRTQNDVPKITCYMEEDFELKPV